VDSTELYYSKIHKFVTSHVRCHVSRYMTLLFLLPPSCMVAPIGETANKFNFPTSFSSTIQSNNQRTFLPSVNIFSNTEMDHSTGTNPVIINDVRGRSPQIYKNRSRDSSMSSTVSSTIYHKRMELNNGMDIDSDPPNRNSRFILQERKRQGNSSQEGG